MTGKPARKKDRSMTGHGDLRKPRGKGKKPPAPDGYFWRSDGKGWQLRKTVGKKQPYIAHLSHSAYQELKKAHRGKSLADALTAWAKSKDGAGK